MNGSLVGILAVLAAVSSGCAFNPLDRCGPIESGAVIECPMPGRLDRSFKVEVPSNWDGVTAVPVLLVFHGGGGNRNGAEKTSCPGGDTSDPACLAGQALARGLAVVHPDGTGTRPVRNARTWNAGGGVEALQCVSGPACRSGADDMAYFDALIVELERMFPVGAIYATGFSNGGAIVHRLACERASRLTAVAPMGGGNQFAAGGGRCPSALPVLHIHGTADPCWTFETSPGACLQSDGKIKIGIPETMEAWRLANGCDGTTTTSAIGDTADDGTRSFRETWQGCASPTELIRIEGGGHTWPRGASFFSEENVGPIAQDFDANALILDFFAAAP